MFNFGNEDKQKDFASGPVPSGSIVQVEMSVLLPKDIYAAPENLFICRTRNGMRQIYCQFVVITGSYANVQWRENINLPLGMQHEQLTDGQVKACRIGGATLRAILESAGKPLSIKNVSEFSGLRFPVKVKLNDHPVERNGVLYWNNAIARVITPDMPEYQEVRKTGEIINESGQTSGKRDAERPAASSGAIPSENRTSMDDFVF